MGLTSIFLIRLPFVCSSHLTDGLLTLITEGRQPKRNAIPNRSPDLGIPSRTDALWPSFRLFCHTGARYTPEQKHGHLLSCLVCENLDLIPIGNSTAVRYFQCMTLSNCHDFGVILFRGYGDLLMYSSSLLFVHPLIVRVHANHDSVSCVLAFVPQHQFRNSMSLAFSGARKQILERASLLCLSWNGSQELLLMHDPVKLSGGIFRFSVCWKFPRSQDLENLPG
jgi:hypothetical protein